MNTNNDDGETTWAEKLARNAIRYRWAVIAAALGFVVAALAGLRDGVRFDSSYRIFFSEDNPQLQAFDALQNVYTKDDNVMLVLTADEGSIYEAEFLEAVQWVTKQGWQVPYSRRVDSVTNFQNSVAVGDDLYVDDLVPEGERPDADAVDYFGS